MTSEEPAAPRILTAPYYERLNDLERRHWWCRSVRRVAIELARPFVRPGAVVLDAGCGAGGLLEAVAERWPDVRAVGVDVSWDALAFARERGLRDLIVGSAAELPVPDQSVNVVFSNDVLQHLAGGEDARAVRDAARVLKPGGILCVRTNPARYRRDLLDGLIRKAGLDIERHLVLHALPAALSKLRRRAATGDHVAESGLSTTVPAAPVNLLMGLYVRVEDFLVSRLPWTLAAGDARIVLARKPS